MTLFAWIAFTLAAWAADDVHQLAPLPATRVTVAKGAYFPRLVAARGGELLAFFKTGAAHIGKGGRASLSRSADGGLSWSPPVTVFDRPDADDGIVATGVTRDGVLHAAAVSYTWTGDRYTTNGWTATTWSIRSHDAGRTWSEPVRVNTAPLDWAYPFGHILEEPDGTLLLSGYGGPLPKTEGGAQISFLVRSRDGGKTWGDYTAIASGYNELTMHPRRDGSLLAVLRSAAGGHMASTYSADGGRAWSRPERISEDREHPPDLLRLAGGGLLLSFGQRNKPFGVQAMLSRDDGKTWERSSRVVLAWDGDHSDLGYPVTIQRKDGRLVTVYYVVHGERDPEGLKGIAPANASVRAVIWDTPANWR